MNGNRKTFIGDKFLLNCGSVAEIIEYNSIEDIKIKTNTGYTTTVQKTQLKLGNIKDPFVRTVHGVGFIGEIYGQMWSKRSKLNWDRLIQRCYSESYLIDTPSYINCITCNEWHNFSNFNKWHEINYIEGYVLDKDLKFYGNKVYSPDKCIYIPSKINNFFFRPSNKTNDLPFGVLFQPGSKTKFKSSLSIKSFDNIIDAQNDYWNNKRIKLCLILLEYPQFTDLLEDYFESFFGELYG